ncbi:MAG: cation:proton antiporter [Nitrososphaerales archaeon]
MPSIELLLTGFLAIILIASLVSIRSKLPYTIALVLIGIALVILSDRYILGSDLIGGIISQIRAYTISLGTSENGGLFVGLVVPPLIFQALMQVHPSDLKSVLRPSFVLATIGVVFATIVGGLLLWIVIGLPWYIAFLFAAVISPTDTATVLELFRRVRVPSKLATLLDTEAAFNDATGIVIFTIILTSITSAKLPLLGAIEHFFFVFAGGMAVGLAVAFIAELLTSVILDRLTETILTISAVYGSYVAATGLGFSGLIAVSVVALYFGNFTIRTAIKPSNREAIRIFWEIAAFIGNSIAFLFIGLRTDILKLSQSLELIVIAYLAVLAARAATVYPILTIFDRLAKAVDRRIPLVWRNVAMLGGMRGALSIALSASIVSSSTISSDNVNTISNMVLGVAFTSIVFQSAFLSRYVKRKFPEEKIAEVLNVRFARAVSEMDALQKLKQDGKISDGDFANELERQKDLLEDLLAEIQTSTGPGSILRSRVTEFYGSVSSNITNPIRTVGRKEIGRNEPERKPVIDKEESGESNSERKAEQG